MVFFFVVFLTLCDYRLGGFLVLLVAVRVPSLVLSSTFLVFTVVWPSLTICYVTTCSLLMLHLGYAGVNVLHVGMGLGRGGLVRAQFYGYWRLTSSSVQAQASG